MRRAKRSSIAWLPTALILSLLPSRAPSSEIILPPSPSEQETQAASELARVWLLATGEQVSIHGSPATSSGVRFFLGDSPVTRSEASLPSNADGDSYRIVTRADGTVILHGATPLATTFAVDRFCSRELKARWFLPGELGEVIPHARWIPHPTDVLVQPAFLSRTFSGLASSGQAWALHNGLHDRWPHGHALLNVIPRHLFDTHPDWFPLLEGKRYRPVDSSDYNWQPALANPAVASEAARYVKAYFGTHPLAEAVSLSENDSIRFDQSPESLAARGPLRWFRNRPDYSDLVFAFMNRVADATSADLPGKHLSAYAYYWCENTPSFPVRPSILPWLTADRTQWYDPSFAQEDQALIRRWCRSGAAIVGCYDYLYGAPFLIPRVTTHLTAESIRFEFDSGVRAFFAETDPNWSFDGPKLWVAAQLLWEPDRPVAALLDEYYRTFFGKAAPAMEQFFSLCEKSWTSQPGPARWIKYYQDPAQAALFPPKTRDTLRADLLRAAAASDDPAVLRRVDFVSTGFATTEAFCSFCEARIALSNFLSENPSSIGPSSTQANPLSKLVKDYREKRMRFILAYTASVAAKAMAPTDLSVYLREDPAANLDDNASLTWRPVPLLDSAWSTVASPSRLDDTTFIWTSTPWLGRGEPSPNRTIRAVASPSGARSLRYEHVASDRLLQWIPAEPGAFYRAAIDFRGRVSPGCEAYLVVSFLDRAGHFVGDAAESRVPLGDWERTRRLEATLRAPASAVLFGFGLYACHQLDSDFAEFSAPSVLLAHPAAH